MNGHDHAQVGVDVLQLLAHEAEAAAFVQRYQEGSAPILQLTRRAVAAGLDQPLADAIRNAEDVYLNQLMSTEDAEEGLKAIMEKRKPVWKDR